MADPVHEFEQMEDAILAALAPLKSEGIKELDLYVGQFDVEKLEDLLPRFACIYITAGQLQMPESEPAGRVKLGATLLVGDQNRRSARAVLRGDAQRRGVYHWLARCHELLHRQKLISNWKAFRLSHERPLVYLPKERICLFEAFYTTEI